MGRPTGLAVGCRARSGKKLPTAAGVIHGTEAGMETATPAVQAKPGEAVVAAPPEG